MKIDRWTLLVGLQVLGWLSLIASVFYYYNALYSQQREQSALETVEGYAKAMTEARRELPNIRSKPSDSREALTRITEGAKIAAIPESQISNVAPQSPVVIPRTKYVREDTAVTLKGLPLAQILYFIHYEESEAIGSICTTIDLRMSDPRQPDGDTLWDAEVILTQISQIATSKKSK